jgi:predicted kinase
VLIAMAGLSGTGKSTVAASIARATGAVVIASDAVRKALAEVHGPAPAAYGEGIYAGDWTERTYADLLRQGEAALRSGRPVILDASFLEPARRERAAALARRARVPFIVVETVADPEVVEARVVARAERHDSISDANLAIYREQRARYGERIDAPVGATLLRVDTTRAGVHGAEVVVPALQAAGLIQPRIPAA